MYKYTIDNKPLFVKDNGDEIKDLTVGAFEMDKYNLSDYKIYRVPNSMVMRPDLISNSAYGTTEYTEMILKYNSISNPFIIDVDDIIIVPQKDNILSVVSPTTEVENNVLVNKSYKYIDPTKYPKKDSTLSDYDNREIEKVLPPNISNEVEEPIVFRNGRVYFGENVGKSCLNNGMTSGEYIRTVIKNNK